MENGFIAKPVMFEESPGYIIAGYMVVQYHEGKKVVEQFVSEAAYNDFCRAIGIVLTMEGEEHGKINANESYSAEVS